MTSRRSLPFTAAAIATAVSAHGQVLYSSDFEADDGGLIVTGGTDWEHGVPTSGPGAAHSGTKCWGTSLAGVPSTDFQGLALPLIDASAATDGDVIVVRWWQYYDDPDPAFFPFPSYRSFAGASSSLASQHIYGRWLRDLSFHTYLPHTGWRRITAVLGLDYATTDLEIGFTYDGNHAEGLYLDDVSVEVVRSTTISVDDFESGPGGFSGSWQHGIQTGCPLPVTAPSGQYVWSTSVDFCTYGAGKTLYSPVLDLSPYAGLEEVYLTWNRYGFFEGADGVHHEISYDGGLTWEDAAGWQLYAGGYASFFDWCSYGIAVDPTQGPVQLRWRVTADDIEWEDGMWIDDFAISVREAIPGSGANPAGSLMVSAGDFSLGATVELSIDDPAGAFPVPNASRVILSLAGNPNLPDGTSFPGYGMAGPGAPGDILIDLSALAGVVDGTSWTPGNPAKVMAQIPSLPTLAGLEVWIQGALIAPGPLDVGLTNGLFEVLTP